MAKVDVKLNSAGVRELLRSEEVRAELQRRAQAIASAAGDGFAADSTIGRERAMAMAYAATPEAAAKEARHRVLTAAIDAGRA